MSMTTPNCWKGARLMCEHDEITLEEVETLYAFLQGECPKGFYIKNMPNLTPDQAFAVIYYLQEGMYLIPDKYEKCRECDDLYDSENEGCSAGLCDAHYHAMCPHCGDEVDCEDCEIYKEAWADAEEGV